MADLSIKAILTAQTSQFQQGMKSAAGAAKTMQDAMSKFNFVPINQALDITSKQIAQFKDDVSSFNSWIRSQGRGVGVSTTSDVVRRITERRNAVKTAEQKTASDRFNFIRQSEQRALKLRQFYARQEEATEMMRAASMSRVFKLSKKAFGALGVASALSGNILPAGSAGSVALNIASGAGIGALAGGAPGAAIGGAVAGLNEFAGWVKRARESAQSFAEAMSSTAAEFSKRILAFLSENRAPVRNFQKELFGRDIEPGGNRALFGGLFGGIGGDRFGRSELYRRGIAASQEERRKLFLQTTPQASASTQAQFVAAAMEKARKDNWFGVSAAEEASIRAAARVQTKSQNDLALRRLDATAIEQNEMIARRRRERQINIGADVLSGFGASLASAPGRLNAGLIPPALLRPVNTFFMNVNEGFDKLTGMVRKWKAEVDAAAEAAQRIAGGGELFDFQDTVDKLKAGFLQGKINERELGFGFLGAREGIISKAEELLNRTPGSFERGGQGTLAEIFKIENRDRAEKKAEEILQDQLDAMNGIADQIGKWLATNQGPPPIAQF